MLDKLKRIRERYNLLGIRMSEPDAMNDRAAWTEMVREHASLEETVTLFNKYERIGKEILDCRGMLDEKPDTEMAHLIREELAGLSAKQEEAERKLRELLLPKDPNDDRNVLLEIRAGTGGEEAALFASDLLRMYLRYADRHAYKVETMTENETEMGGIKEIVLSISGRHGAYSRLKFESGVHRVQRVPETESQGRIQTSAATVAVLPDLEDVQVEINESDLRIDIFRSGGAGGQNVNKVSSAIRITHIPSGIVVQCQNERSQLQNKEMAMRILRSRLYELARSKQEAEVAGTRKSLVGSGDRSERIRTYNYPQGRVTDHRIGLTLYKLDQFLDGDMDEMIDALIMSDREAMMAEEG